jgi:hypothetical protein
MKKSDNAFAAIALAATLAVRNSAFANPGAWRGQSVTEFSADENKAMAWQIVNDGVMGGLWGGGSK